MNNHRWSKFLIVFCAAALVACAREGASEQTQVPAQEVQSAATQRLEEDTPSQAGPPEVQEASAYYLDLIKDKAALCEMVSNRVEEYRKGVSPRNHHMGWPEGFPPLSDLPQITEPDDFMIRQEADLDSMASIYLAVKVGEGYELRMTASRLQNSDGTISWGSGNTFFSSLGDADWNSWALSDLESQ